MTDYVSCPACHGKGLLPLEEAERIRAHDRVTGDEQAGRQRREEAELRRADLAARLEAKRAEAARRRQVQAEIVRADVERRTRDAETRMAELKALLS